MAVKTKLIQIILLALFFLMFFACAQQQNSTFGFLGSEQSERIEDLLTSSDFLERFAIMQFILKDLVQENKPDALRSFVHKYTITFPTDPYNSYYLLFIADYFQERESLLSEYFYGQIINFYDDVEVEGVSTHYLALNNLLNSVAEPQKRIEYFQRLLSDFPEKIDLGEIWYWLAQEYRANGDFEKYFESLIQFQKYPQTIIQGQSNIHQKVAEELEFHYNSRRDWTHPDLNTLVNNIKFALSQKQVSTLERYRAKETFFAMSWLQELNDFNSRPRFDIGLFLLRAQQISYSDDFTIINENEAYLKTIGWSYRIPIWYFYFRKIDYPADPEIHGNWEWAGIFFGDTL